MSAVKKPAVPVTEKDQAKLAKEKIKLDKEKEKKKEKQMKTKLRVKTPGEIHITLVGDKGSSKTTILKSFAQDATKDVSGVFECVSYPITITGVKDKYILRLFDTDPDELFSRIRAITYKTTDIFVICFDLTNEDTFKNCRSWYAEVNQLSAKSPVLLVGTKVDKKDPRIDRKVPESLLQDLLMLYNYIEVDATDANNVKKLIELAVSHLSL